MILLSYTVVLVAVAWIGSKSMGWATTKIWGVLSLSDLFLYMPYFAFGIIFKMNEERIMKIITNRFTVIACLITFIASLSIPMNATLHIICAITGICVIHYVFWMSFQYKMVVESHISHILENIGTMTLEIYLLHYFIIEAMKIVPGIMVLAKLKNTMFEFPVYLLLSFIIITACLGFVYLLRRLNMNKYLFPKSKPRSQTLIVQS